VRATAGLAALDRRQSFSVPEIETLFFSVHNEAKSSSFIIQIFTQTFHFFLPFGNTTNWFSAKHNNQQLKYPQKCNLQIAT
jgi:hypothetical protein